MFGSMAFGFLYLRFKPGHTVKYLEKGEHHSSAKKKKLETDKDNGHMQNGKKLKTK